MTQIAFVAYPGVTALDVGPYEVLVKPAARPGAGLRGSGRRAIPHWLTLPALSHSALSRSPTSGLRTRQHCHEARACPPGSVSPWLGSDSWVGRPGAKAIQLAIEYDPQPPASTWSHVEGVADPTKAAATARPLTAPNRPI